MLPSEMKAAADALRYKASHVHNSDYRREYLAWAQAFEFASGHGNQWLASIIEVAERELREAADALAEEPFEQSPKWKAEVDRKVEAGIWPPYYRNLEFSKLVAKARTEA